jgi:hypothetical protein
MPRYAIFDLDNCLSNDLPRIPLIDWSQEDSDKRYAAYHDKCGEDDAGNLSVYRRVTATHTPVFLTARPAAVALQTRAWISRWLGVSNPILMMRNTGDRRPSVDVKRWQLDQLTSHYNVALEDIKVAYDDRQDIVDMYNGFGIIGMLMSIHDVCAYKKPASDWPKAAALLKELGFPSKEASATTKPQVTAADVLQQMANTFRERNAVYGDNFKMVAKLMAVLFPQGVPSELVTQDQFHLFELLLVKVSRYAISSLTHKDSIHDAAVYAAMCEAILTNQEKG